MNLSDFINIWGNESREVLIYDYELYDDFSNTIIENNELTNNWEKLNEKIPAEFSFDQSLTQFVPKLFLNDKYASAIVERFYTSKRGLIVFLNLPE